MEKTSSGDILKSLEQQYLKKDYESSINTMLKNKQKFSPHTFHYNLGTLHVKNGDLAAGRYHLEKALSHGWMDGQIYSNLGQVKKVLSVEDVDNSDSFFDKSVSFAKSMPGDAFLTISLVFMILSTAVKKFNLIKSFKVLIILLLLSWSPVAFKNLYLSKINFGIALESIPIYEGPSKIFDKKGRLESGAKVIFGKDKGKFIFIQFPYFLSGWVKKENIAFY